MKNAIDQQTHPYVVAYDGDEKNAHEILFDKQITSLVKMFSLPSGVMLRGGLTETQAEELRMLGFLVAADTMLSYG